MRKSFLFLVIFLLFSAANISGDGFYHYVIWKDTLMDIALKYRIDLDELAKVNKISNWNKIYIGQKLWIPKASPSKSDMVNVYIYMVKKGDTLGQLAGQYDSTIWEIASLNHIYNLNRIYTGQKLYIPVK